MKLRLPVLLAMVALLAWSAPVRAQSPAPGMSVNVSLGDVSAAKLPFILAADAGIYARNGLDVTQFITPGAAAFIRGNGLNVPPEFVRSDLVPDIAIGGGSPTVMREVLVATAPQTIIIATNDVTAPFHLFVRPGITKVTDLRGKRIGYADRGDLADLPFHALAHRLGWDPNRDWSMLSGVFGMRVAASANIDAFIYDPTASAEARRLGYRDLGDLSAYKFPILGSGVNVMKSWLPTHRDAATAFLKSMVEAVALLKRDKAATIASMEKWYGLKDPATENALYALAVRTLRSKPYPFTEGLHLLRTLYPDRELQAHSDAYFMDSSFVAALDRSGFLDAQSAQR